MSLWGSPYEATDAEKIDYVYRRLKNKAVEERLNSVWKWAIRASIFYTLFQLYLNPGAFLGGITGGWAKEAFSKFVGDMAKPIVMQMVSEMKPSGSSEAFWPPSSGTGTSTTGANGGSTPVISQSTINNLTPEQKDMIREGVEQMRRKNAPSKPQ